MVESTISIRHNGRQSSVSLQATEARLEAFRQALLREEFKLVSAGENRWEFRRELRLLAGDWPIKLIIERRGERLDISFFMFTPWAWIIGLGLMIVLFLPMVDLQGAPVVFLLAVGVLGLAVYKQRLDFSPDASWQGPPRKQWNEKMTRLLDQVFAGEAGGTP